MDHEYTTQKFLSHHRGWRNRWEADLAMGEHGPGGGQIVLFDDYSWGCTVLRPHTGRMMTLPLVRSQQPVPVWELRAEWERIARFLEQDLAPYMSDADREKERAWAIRFCANLEQTGSVLLGAREDSSATP
jgi:hypothetical protein